MQAAAFGRGDGMVEVGVRDYCFAGSSPVRRHFPLIALTVLTLLPGLLGCQDPDRKAMRAARRDNMDALVKSFQADAAERAGNLEGLNELYTRLNARRAAELNRALKRAGKTILSNNNAWMNYKPARLKQVRAIRNDEPGEISKTIK